MNPIRADGTVAGYFIIHICERCGAERKNMFGKYDSIEALLAVAKRAADDGSGRVVIAEN